MSAPTTKQQDLQSFDRVAKYHRGKAIRYGIAAILAATLLGVVLAQGLGMADVVTNPATLAPVAFLGALVVATMGMLKARAPDLVHDGRGALVSLILGPVWGALTWYLPELRQAETLQACMIYGLLGSIFGSGAYDILLKPVATGLTAMAQPRRVQVNNAAGGTEVTETPFAVPDEFKEGPRT